MSEPTQATARTLRRIGLFDSGSGGLLVLETLRHHYPQAEFYCFSDGGGRILHFQLGDFEGLPADEATDVEVVSPKAIEQFSSHRFSDRD